MCHISFKSLRLGSPCVGYSTCPIDRWKTGSCCLQHALEYVLTGTPDLHCGPNDLSLRFQSIQAFDPDILSTHCGTKVRVPVLYTVYDRICCPNPLHISDRFMDTVYPIILLLGPPR